uniref:Uncharacterized protein n=1 Tax=Ditylenchus dipsaci TaxID=166011 RepID=A0A915DWD9_9BILA
MPISTCDIYQYTIYLQTKTIKTISQASTEHRSNFYTKTLEANHSYKPEPTVYRPSSQPLDATTTYRNGFTYKKDAEIVKPIRQKAELSSTVVLSMQTLCTEAISRDWLTKFAQLNWC